MNEYIVTCRSYEDLENLYDDMETPGGSLYIPDRAVDLVHRRAISRNTHYMLTEEEAAEIRNDERVIACERLAKDRGIVPDYFWTQTNDFNKTTATFAGDDKNWGLYRVIEGNTVSNWGSDDTSEITNKNIVTTASGKNVDVVIVDGHVNPDHPEFAVNSDGSGGSRVNQFNWFQYKSALGYNSHPSTYTYSSSGASPNTNHGTHVAGTVAGNTQGWARDANIYNMAFNDSLSGVTNWDEFLWDYLRHFHRNKSINSATGRRNPTITNHSWGYSYSNIPLSSITSVTYRGATTTVSGTNAQKKVTLEDNGVPVPENTYLYKTPARVAAVDADIQDAIADGVIVISSAGNSYWNCDTSSGNDYNNAINAGGNLYHSRGSTPGSADNVICIGSIGSKVAEYKSNFSNWGDRVDIWAPGSDIISAVYDSSSATTENNGAYTPIIADSRNSSYHLASISGTSMSSPQVCGVIACLVEQEPFLTQAEALRHLKENALTEVGTTGTINHNSYEAFGNSHNRYLFMPKKRPDTGTLSPNFLHKNRNSNSAGVKYPRVRNNRVFK